MPIKIVRNDITKIECDTIVNAANSSLLGGDGFDSIHRADSKGFLLEYIKLGGCKVSRPKFTKAYNLPFKYVIYSRTQVKRRSE